MNQSPIDAFLDAAVPLPESDHKAGALAPARALLADHPELMTVSFFAACVVGDVKAVAAHLAADASLAKSIGGVRNWPAMCYLTFSRFLRDEKKRAGDFVKCAKLLLNAGADPNCWWPAANEPNERENALYGAAGIANCAPLTKLLLDAGADANDGESLYHASEFKDNAALRVLLAAKPREPQLSYCMCHKMDMEDPAGVKLFLDAGADANILIHTGLFKGKRPLHFAVFRRRSLKVFRLLLKAGADPTLAAADGTTPYRLARKLGENDAAELMLAHGAVDDLDNRARFLAALSSADRRRVNSMLKRDPLLLQSLTPADHKLLVDAAEAGNTAAVKLMLDVGFPITARGTTYGGWDGSALDHAAWRGHVDTVRLLLERGIDPTTQHGYGGNALGAAIHGASHAGHRNGPAVVELIAKRMPAEALKKALEYARTEPNEKVVRMLERIDPLVASLPVHRRSHKIAQWKPIMDAAYTGDVKRAASLLDGGADPNAISTTPHRYRPLHRAIERKKTAARTQSHERIVQLLLDRGADPRLRALTSRLTTLQLAGLQSPRFVPLLARYFKPLDVFHAAVTGDGARMNALLKRDPSLSKAVDENGWSVLHYAAGSAMFELGATASATQVRIIRQLLAAGADPMATYLYGEKWPIPVLYHCCGAHDNAAVARVLFEAGATPYDNETVYHAADENHCACLAVIEEFANAKKLATECTRCLRTQLHWGHTRGARWLLEHGADPNALRPEQGESALHAAVRSGVSDAVLQLLLEHGADPQVITAAGKTAIEIAKKAGRQRVLRTLLRWVVS